MAHTNNPANNWQDRQYESFGRLRIDSGNPELGNDGASVYGLVAEGSSGNTSYLGMTEGGQYHIFNDKCFNITGGVKSEGGQAAINLISPHGDICITCQQNGDVKITGRNIILDATDTLTFEANKCNFNVDGVGGIDFNTPRLHTTAKEGNLVRDVNSFMGVAFKGTKVGMDEVSSVINQATPQIAKASSELNKFVESGKIQEGLTQALDAFGGFG